MLREKNYLRRQKTKMNKTVTHWWKKSKMTWTDTLCSWTVGINIVKITVLPKAIYRFNAIPVKLPITFFTELEQKFFTICLETQKTPNSQSNLEKEKKKIELSDFRLYYKAIVIKTVQGWHQKKKKKYRSMEQYGKPRDKPMHLWKPYLWQRRQEYTLDNTYPLQ